MPRLNSFTIVFATEGDEILQVSSKPYDGSRTVLLQALEYVVATIRQEIQESN